MVQESGMVKTTSRNVAGYRLLRLSSEDRKILLKTMDRNLDELNAIKLNQALSTMLRVIYKNMSFRNSLEDFKLSLNTILKISELVVPVIRKNPTPKTTNVKLENPRVCLLKIPGGKSRFVKMSGIINVMSVLIPRVDEKKHSEISERLSNKPYIYLLDSLGSSGNISAKNLDYIDVSLSDVGIEDYVKFYIGMGSKYIEDRDVIFKKVSVSMKEEIVPAKDVTYGDFKESERQLLNKVVYERFKIADDVSSNIEDVEFEDTLTYDSNVSITVDTDVRLYFTRLVDSGIFLEPEKIKSNTYMYAVETLFEQIIVDYYKYVKNKDLVVEVIRPMIIILSSAALLIDLHINKGIVQIDVESHYVKSYSNSSKNQSILDYYMRFILKLIKHIFRREYDGMTKSLDVKLFGFLKNIYQILTSKDQFQKFPKKVDIEHGIINLPYNDPCLSLDRNYPSEIADSYSDENMLEFLFKYPGSRFRMELTLGKKFEGQKISNMSERMIGKYDSIKSQKYIQDASLSRYIREISKIFKSKNLISSTDMFSKNMESIGMLKKRMTDDYSNDEDAKQIFIEYREVFYKTAFKELRLLYNIPEDMGESNTYKFLFYKSIHDGLKSGLYKAKDMKEFISDKITETKLTDLSNKSIALKKLQDEEKKNARNYAFYNMTVDERESSGFDSMTAAEKEAFLNDFVDSQTQGQFMQLPYED